MDGLSRTPEVASELGLTSAYLNTILSRHPHLRPGRKIGADYWWTRKEIEAAKEYRKTAKQGRPKKT